MKKQISPVAIIISIVLVLVVVLVVGYQTYLKPLPPGPATMTPGMQKMMTEMKAMGARIRAGQSSQAQAAPSQDNPMGR
jgi:hypothetical protein